jgi:fatty acid desaturase
MYGKIAWAVTFSGSSGMILCGRLCHTPWLQDRPWYFASKLVSALIDEIKRGGMENHTASPFGLRGGKKSLSKAAMAEIMRYKGPRPWIWLRTAALAWVTIILAVWWAEQMHSLWATLFAVVIVASRQNVLGLLIHEQAHCLGFPSRYDWLANLLAAYPLLLVSVEGYAQVHLSHHKFYFTQKDPDFLRKSGPDWTFPMPAGRLAWLFLTDVAGLNVVRLIKGKQMKGETFKRPHATPAWVRLVLYLPLAAVFTLTGTWSLFLIYWLLPLLTVMQALVRLGAISEHKYNLEHASVEDTSPIIMPRWWEKLILTNLNFTLHPYHHYFPGISYSYLPKVHAIFCREGLVDESKLFRGYWPYLRFLVSGRPGLAPR